LTLKVSRCYRIFNEIEEEMKKMKKGTPKNSKKYAPRSHLLGMLLMGLAVFFADGVLGGVAVTAAATKTAPLPDALNEWRGSPTQTTNLTASEELGRWTSRTYNRTSPIARVEANLMEGSGPGSLYVPEGEVVGDEGLLGFSSTYETLTVAGKPAILERGDTTGQALAVTLGKERTLTLETKSLSEKELLDFAAELIAALEE
jgi:hypothetical protein